jgi:ribosome-binding factor A
MRRVSESVRAVVAEGVGELKDPRIGMVTVTGVHVTPDLREATVYVSVLGNEKKRRATLAGLESAHGVLQARINRELSLRRTPTITFSMTRPRACRPMTKDRGVTADLPAPTEEAADNER